MVRNMYVHCTYQRERPHYVKYVRLFYGKYVRPKNGKFVQIKYVHKLRPKDIPLCTTYVLTHGT